MFPPSLQILAWFSCTRRGCHWSKLGWLCRILFKSFFRTWTPFGLGPCRKMEGPLVQTWKRFWSHYPYLSLGLGCDLLILLKNNDVMLFMACIPYLMMVGWLVHLMLIYVMMMLLYFLWCMLCDVSITISYSHILSKVFLCNFLITTRKVEISESCFARDMVGRWAMWSIIS
jgi:hypothetical protein